MNAGPSPAERLAAVRAGGKPALARALAAIETDGDGAALAALLDAAAAAPGGHVIGLTGPPGVGKSTLTAALLKSFRAAGESVGVIAVDPSSRLTGGALLGDRTRIRTDPADDGVFIRSMAARDRLGGLSDHAVAAIVLMRAVRDRVVVETVGVGQSEGDVAAVADTVVLCIQPGSGDSLQFMKAGVMELPDIVVVTKADMGAPVRRARADVEGALSLGHTSGPPPAVVLVSAATGEGLDDLAAAIAAHRGHAAENPGAGRRAGQPRQWLADAVRTRFGTRGLAETDLGAALAAGGPFAAIRAVSLELAARLARGPAGEGTRD
ncbi:methylmalonyl Co-A mutase-associated GTPase MeaB [Pseudoxanthobacter sp. M-2]|uniref:ArgK/MeaB family GTPase n=1 Tax=Pseudoxanthobacter sp. M-2 TaxID=3078754 RepID=UPI0038FC88D8